MSFPNWLPSLVLFETYNGNWQSYVNAVYAYFKQDFIDSKPIFCNLEVRIFYEPVYQDKPSSFWHITSIGKVENERTPDFRRCERIRWLRPMIENTNTPEIKIWDYQEAGNKIRTYIWLENFNYVVILEKKRACYLLITAFYIEGASTKKKLKRKYEQREL